MSFDKFLMCEGSVANHLSLIQKIIQSTYPMVNVNESRLFKSQHELIGWVDHAYNIRIGVLGWIGRLKKQCLQQMLNEEGMGVYLSELESLLRFY